MTEGIGVDGVHPRALSERFRPAMEEAVREVAAMGNETPVLDRCPLCDNGRIERHATVGGFEMDRCHGCGLIFCNPYPSAAQLRAIYNCAAKRLENDFFRETLETRVRIFAPRVEMIRRRRDGGRLLDIGSAVGVFLEALLRSGAPFRITCCEMSSDSCDRLRGNPRYTDVEILCRDFMDLPEERVFSVLTLWDTIEHIVDLHGAMEKFRGLLEPGGLLAFSTPNTGSFEWRIGGKAHPQLAPPTHVNLLNEGAIRLLLDRHGFRLLEARTPNASLDIGYVKRLVESGTVENERLGLFLREELGRPEFERLLDRYLVETRQGGNFVILAEAGA